MGRLENKVGVITGAASGIGRATALRFASEGAAVAIGDLNSDGGETTAGEIAKAGGRAVFQKTDVTIEEDIKALVERAVGEFGRLDIIYNNAGLGGAVGSIAEITAQNWDRTFAVLLRAVFLGIKHAVPEMKKAGGGSIISTASVAGLRGSGLHAYSAAKAGVINLTRSAAIELGPHKIRVNCICPGGINTPLLYNRAPGGYEAMAQMLSKWQPIQRAGAPEDIAGMALYLASDDAEWVTGTAMVVDGGMMAGFGGSAGQRQRARVPAAEGFSGPSFER